MADDPTPDLILDKPPDSPTTITLGAGATLILLGILVVLGGILYVLIRHTGVFEPSPAEAQCAALNGAIELSTAGGRVCDRHPKTAEGELFGPEDFAVDEWANVPQVSEKELHCRDSGGTVVWSTNGAKICDIPPATGPGENFGPEDWGIVEGWFINPSRE